MRLPIKPETLNAILAPLYILLAGAFDYKMHFGHHWVWMFLASCVLVLLSYVTFEEIKATKRARVTFEKEFGCKPPVHSRDITGLILAMEKVQPIMRRRRSEIQSLVSGNHAACEYTEELEERYDQLSCLSLRFWIQPVEPEELEDRIMLDGAGGYFRKS